MNFTLFEEETLLGTRLVSSVAFENSRGEGMKGLIVCVRGDDSGGGDRIYKDTIEHLYTV